jgi:peptidoglycan/LPS O-acetylase OafA/YrhL
MHRQTTNTATQTSNRIGGLDGIRGLACLAVFAEHFYQKTLVGGEVWLFDLGRLLVSGWGVAILFILSGFLLSIPFWRALYTGENFPDLGTFWLKRLARLTPAYFICLTILVIHNQLWKNPDRLQDILLHYLFLFNYADFAFYSINPPFWALGIIAQFYLLLPILFLLIGRSSPRFTFSFILMACIGAYIMHFVLMAYLQSLGFLSFHNASPRPDSPVWTHSLLAHLPHFLMGVLGAYFFLSWQQKGVAPRGLKTSHDVVFWMSFSCILIILSTPLQDFLQIPYGRYTLPWVPLLLTLMIVYAPRGQITYCILASSPLQFTGVISYGIYVYHYPVLNLTSRHLSGLGMNASDHWLIFGTSALLLTILVASGSYFLLEQPILRLVRKLA